MAKPRLPRDRPPMPANPFELLDERSVPDLRDRFGTLSTDATGLDVAVGRVRLMGVDLRPEEMARLNGIRVLLAELNARTFGAEADCVILDPDRRRTAEQLSTLLKRGVLEIRVAPLATWTPDFSIFRRDGEAFAAILGFHWFQRPYPYAGPVFATVLGPEGGQRVARRFEDLWSLGHDVTTAVEGMLDGARSRATIRRGDASSRD